METKNYIYKGEKFLIGVSSEIGEIVLNYKGENAYVTPILSTDDCCYRSLTTNLSYKTVEEAVNATCDYLLDQYLQERKKEVQEFFDGIGNEEV